MPRKKILLIRFSAIGDVAQCLSVPTRLKELNADVHWVTRDDLAGLLHGHPSINRVWTLDRSEGFSGVARLIIQLRKEKFTEVYDAHNNLRSRLISWALFPRPVLRRKISRWKRFLLFRFHINTYRKPFSGQRDLLEPLKAWDLSEELPPVPQIFCGQDSAVASAALKERGWSSFTALAPSAAYPLKRWPLEHFAELIRQNPNSKFVVLGGPGDKFLAELEAAAPDRVLNLAGKLTLTESVGLLQKARLLVSNDTGVLHMGEQLGLPTVALMGPAPFGFPSRPSTKILERDLACRPCSKHGQGPCVNPEFQKCLRDITPRDVARAAQDLGRPL